MKSSDEIDSKYTRAKDAILDWLEAKYRESYPGFNIEKVKIVGEDGSECGDLLALIDMKLVEVVEDLQWSIDYGHP